MEGAGCLRAVEDAATHARTNEREQRNELPECREEAEGCKGNKSAEEWDGAEERRADKKVSWGREMGRERESLELGEWGVGSPLIMVEEVTILYVVVY